MNKQIIQNAIYDFAVAVDLSATDDLNTYTGVYVGGAGDVKVDMKLATTGAVSTVTFKAVPVGTQLSIQVSKIYKTGTTATLLIGMA